MKINFLGAIISSTKCFPTTIKEGSGIFYYSSLVVTILP